MGGAAIVAHVPFGVSPAAASARPRTSTAAKRAIGGATPGCPEHCKLAESNQAVLIHSPLERTGLGGAPAVCMMRSLRTQHLPAVPAPFNAFPRGLQSTMSLYETT